MIQRRNFHQASAAGLPAVRAASRFVRIQTSEGLTGPGECGLMEARAIVSVLRARTLS